MIPAAFDYAAPATVREAVALLRSSAGDARPLAGGQSLIPMMRMRLVNPGLVVDLSRIADLAYVREHDDGIAIGAMTTYRSIETSPLVRERFPLLAAVAAQVADLQVRNRGTLGGAIAHADPSADLPALMVAAE
ncbi:MAG: FAD binding domain-containing protein, partial [Chloroflexi bacterium]|nr:FAD binding domain-containing protein [Chloroflexota bacterium]